MMKKIHFDKKTVIAGIFLFLIFSFVTISCALPQPQMVAQMPKDYNYLDISSPVSMNNIEEKNGVYTHSQGDPNFVLQLSKSKLTSIAIDFSSQLKLEEGGSVKIYYAEEGKGFTELDSYDPYHISDEQVYFFQIPTNHYSLLRIDVDGDFMEPQILLSSEPLVLSSVSQSISPMRLILAILIPLAVIAVLFVTNILQKFTNRVLLGAQRLKKYIKKYRFHIIMAGAFYVLLAFISAGTELIYFRLVDKTPNSLGMQFDLFRFLFIFGVLATIFTLFLLRKVAGAKPEYLFLAVVLIGGILITAGLPPVTGTSWDDQVHYSWAATVPGVTDQTYTQADKNLFDIKRDFKDEYNYKSKSAYAKEQNQLHEYGTMGTKEGNSLQIYQRLGHIPATITMKICNTVGMSFTTQIILARTSTLLMYALIMFFAIKKLSSGKMILSVLALAPTYIYIACNFGYDYWVTALLTVGFVYYLEELRHPKELVSLKNLLIILGSFILGCGPKSIYFIFFLFPLFVNKEKIKNLKQHRLLCLGGAALVIGFFLLITFSTIGGGGDSRGGEVSTGGQIAFIFSHPIQYTKILLGFLSSYWNPQIFITGNYLTNWSYVDTVAGSAILIILLFVVAFTDKNEKDIHSSHFITRILVAMTAFAGTSLVATALYIDFTPVGHNGILGCQPRYLFPFLFPIFSVIGSSKVKNRINRKIYNYTVIGISTAVLYFGIWNNILTFYH